MRFLDLALSKFGTFTDVVLDFSSGGNLQVIYGPNEAGKSTALRAIRSFLYGIEVRTGDDHVHEKSTLRIGARLENRNGESQQLIRRKGSKNTLLDSDENAVDDGVLSAWLGGVSEPYFSRMFGLDHGSLVHGGEQLLAGEGELGQVLFGVGAGVGSMRSLLGQLREEARDIFTQRGTKQPLAKALAEFKEAQKHGRQAALKPKDYKAVVEDIAVVDRLEREINDRCGAALNERARLERLARVIPVVGNKKDLEGRLDELGACVLLPDEAPGERVAALKALSKLEPRRLRLVADRVRCVAERDALDVPKSLLAEEAVLDQLAEDLGSERTAANDCVGLESRVRALREQLGDMLRDLGKDVAIADIESLEVGVPLRARIRELAQAHGKLDGERQTATENVAKAQAKADRLEKSLELTPAGRDAGGLRRAVDGALRAGDLGDRRRALDTDIARREREATDGLSALPRWQGRLDDLVKLEIPDLEAVELFRTTLDQHAADERVARADKKRALGKIASTDESIAALQQDGAVPTQAELNGVREQRDGLWDRARAVWLDGAAAGDEGPRKLADRVRGSVVEADRVADRLREDAKRAGQLSTLTAERRRWVEDCARLDQEIDRLQREEKVTLAQWRERWSGAGIEPATPTEMRTWLAKHERLVLAAREVQDQRQARETLDSEIAAHLALCAAELTALGEPAPTEAETLAALIDRGAALLQQLDVDRRTRDQHTLELAELRANQSELVARAERCQSAVAEWEASWADAMGALELSASASTAEAEAVLEGLRSLLEKWSTLRQTGTRIEHIKENSAAFAERVAALASSCASDLHGRPAQDAAADLVKRLREARRARDARERLDKRIDEIAGELREVDGEIASERDSLEHLLRQAEVATIEALEEAERRSGQRRVLERELEAAMARLRGEGLPVEQLIEEATDVAFDTLPGLQDAVTTKLAAAEAERTEVQTRAADLRARQREMDGKSDAADQAVRAQGALADVRAHAERYACLTLAARVLEDEVERYRRDNQGPILGRAGEMFRRLSCGSFAGLATGFGKNDETVLLCKRTSGATLTIDALSDGTRDQLYLALRLASLEQRALANEPLPLILDDLLINFDDDRAQAALELLSEIAETTQVLFFTHHTRLLELAEAAVPADRWARHDLRA